MVTHPRRREGAVAAAPRLHGVVIDTPAAINDLNLAFLDASDTILEVVTYDSTTIHNTIAMADAFRMIGYSADEGPLPREPRRLRRRHRPDAAGARARAACPEHRSSRTALLVVQSNNEGVPFVLAEPAGARSARTSCAPPTSCSGARRRRPQRAGSGPGRAREVADPRPIGVFDSGVGGLTVLREIVRRLAGRIHDLPRRQRPRARTASGPTTRSARSRPRPLDELAARDVKALVVACNTSTAVALRDLRARYDLPVLGVVRPGAAAAALATRNRRVGRDRHPGDGAVARLLQRDQGREPGRRGLRARDAAPRPDGRGRAS